MTNPHTPAKGCPRAEEAFSRPFDEPSNDWMAHKEHCATCQQAFHELREIGRLARALPVPVWHAEQVAAGEARLLATLEKQGSVSEAEPSPVQPESEQGVREADAGDWIQQLAEVPERRRKLPAYVWALLAASLLLGFGMLLGRTTTATTEEFNPDVPDATTAIYRASVHSDDARYALVSPQPNEIIRLYDGTITVSVTPLQPGERFRVITGDGEVEVHGTIFDITAIEDSLTTVRVHEGVVAVRPEEQPATELRHGDRWTLNTGLADLTPPLPAATTPQPPSPLPIEPHLEPDIAPLPTAPPSAQGRPSPDVPQHAAAHAMNPRDASSDTRADRDAATRATDGNPQSGTGAAPTASTAVDVPPSTPTGPDELAFQRGWELLQQGQASAAATAFAQVGSQSSVAEDAAFWRGIALGRNRQLQASERALLDFVRRYPASARVAEAWLAIGMIRSQDGGADARVALERARELGTGAVRTSADTAIRQLDAVGTPD